MKVFFSNYDSLENSYYAGGGAYAIHSLAKRLAKKHDVTVLIGSYPKSKSYIKDAVHYKVIGFSVGQNQIDQFLYQMILPFYFLFQKFDVWFESFTPPLSTAFLPWFTKKPVIGVAHLLGGKEMSKKYHLPFLFIESFGLRQYKHIIALSDFSAEQIKASGTTSQITIIPNGLDADILNRKSEEKKEYILFLGRLDVFHKGLDILIDAYKSVANSVEYKLYLAGSGLEKDVNFIKEKIKEYDLEKRIILLGKIEGEKKWQLLESSIMTVIPSRLEGFSITALEAMACKSALIISDIPGLRWIPDQAAIRVSDFNPNAFASAIIELSENKELRESITEKAYSSVQKYTWESVVEQYNTLIEKATTRVV